MRDAPFIRRFVALILDLIISTGFLAGVLYFLEKFLIYDMVRPFLNADPDTYLYVYLLFLIVFFIYDLLSTALLRSTPGKIIMSVETTIRVGFSFIRLFFRSLVKTITVAIAPIGIPISLIFAALRNSSELFHDLVGKTQVISDTGTPKLIALLIFAASVALIIIFYSEYHLLIIDFDTIDFPGLYKGVLEG